MTVTKGWSEAYGLFLKGEVKIAYPGPRSNPNLRPCQDDSIDELGVDEWVRFLESSLGFQRERTYEKQRWRFRTPHPVGRHEAEVEADRFTSAADNRALAGHAFFALSVEVMAEDRSSAYESLDSAFRLLMSGSSFDAGGGAGAFLGPWAEPTADKAAHTPTTSNHRRIASTPHGV